jgi:hypothetical protein
MRNKSDSQAIFTDNGHIFTPKHKNYNSFFNEMQLTNKNISSPQYLIKIFQKLVENNLNYIFCLNSFLSNLISICKESKSIFESIEIDFESLNLNEKISEIKASIKGCSNYCRFCSRKCEESKADHQDVLHNCSHYGHQIKIFKNALVEYKDMVFPSLFTCDTTNQARETKDGGEYHLKWEEYVKLKAPEWNIAMQRDIQEIAPLIDNLNKFWQNYGETFTNNLHQNGIESDYQEIDIRDYIAYFNKRRNDQCGHIYICLDISGSMAGGFFDHSKERLKMALRTLIDLGHDNFSYVSLSCFNEDASNIFDFQLLQYELFEEIDKIPEPKGQTKFEPPLNLAINSINENDNLVDFNIITMITDGCAPFPTPQIASIKEMISNGSKIILHWIAISSR